MRTLIVAVTCLALGAGLNAPGTGAKGVEDTPVNPFLTSDMGAELDEVRGDLQVYFNGLDLIGLQDLLVKTEWQKRDLAEKNERFLKETNQQRWEILELRSKLRKCEKP